MGLVLILISMPLASFVKDRLSISSLMLCDWRGVLRVWVLLLLLEALGDADVWGGGVLYGRVCPGRRGRPPVVGGHCCQRGIAGGRQALARRAGLLSGGDLSLVWLHLSHEGRLAPGRNRILPRRSHRLHHRLRPHLPRHVRPRVRKPRRCLCRLLNLLQQALPALGRTDSRSRGRTA